VLLPEPTTTTSISSNNKTNNNTSTTLYSMIPSPLFFLTGTALTPEQRGMFLKEIASRMAEENNNNNFEQNQKNNKNNNNNNKNQIIEYNNVDPMTKLMMRVANCNNINSNKPGFSARDRATSSSSVVKTFYPSAATNPSSSTTNCGVCRNYPSSSSSNTTTTKKTAASRMLTLRRLFQRLLPSKRVKQNNGKFLYNENPNANQPNNHHFVSRFSSSKGENGGVDDASNEQDTLVGKDSSAKVITQNELTLAAAILAQQQQLSSISDANNNNNQKEKNKTMNNKDGTVVAFEEQKSNYLDSIECEQCRKDLYLLSEYVLPLMLSAPLNEWEFSTFALFMHGAAKVNPEFASLLV
jgi:hypothetical protein